MSPTEPNTPVQTEEHRIDGEHLVQKVKELIRQGNARRIIIKGENGHTIMEIPLAVGMVGALLMPVWVAVGAIAALAAHYTIVVVKNE